LDSRIAIRFFIHHSEKLNISLHEQNLTNQKCVGTQWVFVFLQGDVMKKQLSGKYLYIGYVVLLMNFPAISGGVWVEYPKGGEVFAIGDAVPIQWSADTTIVYDCVIEISVDGGKTFESLTRNSIGLQDTSWGEYQWVVPDSVMGNYLVSDNCQIRIASYTIRSNNGTSGIFSIVKKKRKLSIDYPKGGSEFAIGDTMPIKWSADTNLIRDCNIGISIDGGITFNTITEKPVSVLDTIWSNYQWIIPDSIQGNYLVSNSCKVFIVENNDGDNSDTSGLFTITKEKQPVKEKSGESNGKCGGSAVMAMVPPLAWKVRRIHHLKKRRRRQ